MTHPQVYVVLGAGTGNVKIGWSDDVDARVATMQPYSPVSLVEIVRLRGGAQLEAALHRYFADRRLHGEWFDFGDVDDIEHEILTAAGVISRTPVVAAAAAEQRAAIARAAREHRPRSAAACTER